MKHAVSRTNSKPRPVALRYGGESALLSCRLNKSTPEYKFVAHHIGELVQHLGGPEVVSVMQREIAEQCARLRLLETLCFGEVIRHGAMANGVPTPAYIAYQQAVGKRTDLMRLLGLQRHEKLADDLSVWLAEPETETSA
jgi:hypothetical protein